MSDSFFILRDFFISSGFVMWLCETWHNSDQFPRSFISGLFEGFWWSFISMTTVGYGDKTPTRFLGRIFAVIWIFMGITITSMYIGAMAGKFLFHSKTPLSQSSGYFFIQNPIWSSKYLRIYPKFLSGAVLGNLVYLDKNYIRKLNQ